jgi:hypothetical protein
VIASILVIVLVLTIVIFFLVKHHHRRWDKVRIIPNVIWLCRFVCLIKIFAVYNVLFRHHYFWSFIHLHLLWVLVILK